MASSGHSPGSLCASPHAGPLRSRTALGWEEVWAGKAAGGPCCRGPGHRALAEAGGAWRSAAPAAWNALWSHLSGSWPLRAPQAWSLGWTHLMSLSCPGTNGTGYRWPQLSLPSANLPQLRWPSRLPWAHTYPHTHAHTHLFWLSSKILPKFVGKTKLCFWLEFLFEHFSEGLVYTLTCVLLKFPF